jgi:hypothetical protein
VQNCLKILYLATLIFVAANRCLADGFSLGDAANYAVLYEGAGGNSLQFNQNVTGNVGIGGTGQFGGSNPGVLTGSLYFSASNSGQYSGNAQVTGPVLYNQTSVQTDLNTLNTLSSTLGAETGTSLAINIGNGVNQVVNANAGTLINGNDVFTISSFHFVNGGTLTINADPSNHNVVINIPTSVNPQFGGAIVLGGGLVSDQVLFNVTGGTNLTGGNALQINTNGATEAGTFLDPNGSISVVHSVLDGRVFGGDSQNMSIVSGANIVAPPIFMPVPEPSVLVSLIGMGAIGLFCIWQRRQRPNVAN